MKPLPTDELEHFAKHSSEILIGENAKENPEFIIVPIKRNTNEN